MLFRSIRMGERPRLHADARPSGSGRHDEPSFERRDAADRSEERRVGQESRPRLPAFTVKLSKYSVDDVALVVCKTGAEEAGVTEVRTNLSEKKFELWREIKV